MFSVHFRWAEGSDHNQLGTQADGAITSRLLHQQLNTPAWKWPMSFPLTTLDGHIHMVLPYMRGPTRQSPKYLANSLPGSQGRRKPASTALFDSDQEGSRRRSYPEENDLILLGSTANGSPCCHQRAQPLSLYVSHRRNNGRAPPLFSVPSMIGEATEKALLNHRE